MPTLQPVDSSLRASCPDLSIGHSWPIPISSESTKGTPTASSIGITLLAWAVRFCATINFIGATLPHQPQIVDWLANWVPFEISVGRRLLMLMTAVLLFTLSSGLERGKKVAWFFTIVALTVAPFIHFGRMVIWPQVLLNLPLVIFLYTNRRYFTARSDPRYLWAALILCPILFIALLTYGTMRLHDLTDETGGSDSWSGCFQAASELIFVQNSYTQFPQSNQSEGFFSLLRMGGTSIALLAVYLTLRPGLLNRAGQHERKEKSLGLINQFGGDPMTTYATLEDKNYFVASTGGAAISYVVVNRFAVTLADPVGPEWAQKLAIAEFAEFCRRQDWVPIFYEISEELLPAYWYCRFSTFQIGEDARVAIDQFDLKGGDFHTLRTRRNKALREGMQFRWYDENSPQDKELELQLSQISKRWLDGKGGTEMAFDIGAFSHEDLRGLGTGIALDKHGNPIAFATWRPYAQGNGRVLDLMRSLPEVRNILDFILVESIFHFRSRGIREVSLGNAPLARASMEYASNSVEDRLVRFIYENLNQIYPYKSLFEFKRKYRPKWRPRFLAYPPGESLPLLSLALVRLHTSRTPWNFLATRM